MHPILAALCGIGVKRPLGPWVWCRLGFHKWQRTGVTRIKDVDKIRYESDGIGRTTRVTFTRLFQSEVRCERCGVEGWHTDDAEKHQDTYR